MLKHFHWFFLFHLSFHSKQYRMQHLVLLQKFVLWLLILFIFFTAAMDLIMVSASAKWTFMSFIFIPFFAESGISPDVVQCAYRIGDSPNNAIAPFMFYLPLILTYMQQYDRQATYGTLLKYTWRYSVYILLAWTLFFIAWYEAKLPFGL